MVWGADAVAIRPVHVAINCAANQGSVFLDEMGDLSPKLQVKLLRVLQERRSERVGSASSVEIDVRANKDLEAAIREGTFRQDLYYRPNVVPIYLPPLRERREDIPLRVDHQSKRYRIAR